MLKLVQNKPEDFPDYVCENQQLYRHVGSRPDDEVSVPWKLCVAKEHVSECCQNAMTSPWLDISESERQQPRSPRGITGRDSFVM